MRVWGIVVLFTVSWLWLGAAALEAQTAPSQETQTAQHEMRPLSLDELEQMALENNPTIAQARARVDSAEGRRIQARLYPNPNFGYEGEEISIDEPDERGIHSLVLEQKLVTAGKLKYKGAIFAKDRARAEAELDAQKMRVLNDVRIAYYRVLGAQKIVELRERLAQVAGDAVDISSQLFNVGQADKADVLEAEVEAQKAELGLIYARNRHEREWATLASTVGNPRLPKTGLTGELDSVAPPLDQQTVKSALLRESPQLKAAQAAIEQAEASLQYERAVRFPDVSVRAGLGYSNEFDEAQALLGVTLPLPLFDRNQGNIASARSQLERARQEVYRLELTLSARLASLSAEYSSSLEATDRYRNEIIPRAEMAYNLYLQKFKQMAASYPQVLIAQRNYFQAQVEYVEALSRLWETRARIEGYLLTGGLEQPGDSASHPALNDETMSELLDRSMR